MSWTIADVTAVREVLAALEQAEAKNERLREKLREARKNTERLG